jgi:hypothetical protein
MWPSALRSREDQLFPSLASCTAREEAKGTNASCQCFTRFTPPTHFRFFFFLLFQHLNFAFYLELWSILRQTRGDSCLARRMFSGQHAKGCSVTFLLFQSQWRPTQRIYNHSTKKKTRRTRSQDIIARIQLTNLAHTFPPPCVLNNRESRRPTSLPPLFTQLQHTPSHFPSVNATMIKELLHDALRWT